MVGRIAPGNGVSLQVHGSKKARTRKFAVLRWQAIDRLGHEPGLVIGIVSCVAGLNGKRELRNLMADTPMGIDDGEDASRLQRGAAFLHTLDWI